MLACSCPKGFGSSDHSGSSDEEDLRIDRIEGFNGNGVGTGKETAVVVSRQHHRRGWPACGGLPVDFVEGGSQQLGVDFDADDGFVAFEDLWWKGGREGGREGGGWL